MKSNVKNEFNEFHARTLIKQDGEIETQLLIEHLTNVSILTSKHCSKFTHKEMGELLGYCHDLGKYSNDFQKRIRGENIKVDHSTAGGVFLKEKLQNPTFKLLVYSILGHHGGLRNYGITEDSESSISKRIDTFNDKDDLTYKINMEEIKPLLENLTIDLEEKIKKENLKINLKYKDEKISSFQLFIYIRFLYSCLVDADRLDAEHFAEKFNQDSIKTQIREHIYDFEKIYNDFFAKMKTFTNNNELNSIRNEIQQNCLEKAKNNKGFYSLCVPTGGGKTFSSMAFALEHLKVHNLDRIIYAIPFTSIIEQTAKAFSDIIGTENILEHHSNFEKPEDNFEYTKYDMLSENWDSPIIITTNVQFFESLFKREASKCRKLHNICNSVIILDEVQAIPMSYLKPCMYALNELVENYGCTVVFCSATQIDFKENKVLPNETEITPIVNNLKIIDEKLKRVEYFYLGKVDLEEISNKINKESQSLTIVNTKKCALEIFNMIPTNQNKFYLSTNMYSVHRKEVIKKIKDLLKNNQPCTVVSTQILEAGVDIDFPIVFRSIAGIDSIVQAGGRCNREGKLNGLGKCFVFEPDDEYIGKGSLKNTSAIAKGIITNIMLKNENDFINDEIIQKYYKSLLSQTDDKTDEKKILPTIYEGISYGGGLEYKFETVSNDFKLISENGYSVVVECKETDNLFSEINYMGTNIKAVASKLSMYSISIPNYTFDELLKGGGISTKNFSKNNNSNSTFYVLSKNYYNKDIGLMSESNSEIYNM